MSNVNYVQRQFIHEIAQIIEKECGRIILK